MWNCPFCGSKQGVIFTDLNLKGMLCMDLECGRFHQMNDSQFKMLTEEENTAGSLA